MKTKWFFFILLFWFSLLGTDIEFKASINADKIGIDDILVFTITYKGVNNPPQPDISAIKDFRTTQTSQSTEFRFVNGVSSYYTNFVFYLQPQKTGTLTIPPVSYDHKGVTYKTSPFSVEVVKGSVSPRTPPRQQPRSLFDDDFFSSPFKRRKPEEIDIKLRTYISKKKVIKGEQVIYKVLLYTRNRIESINMVSNQSFPGFWQEWYPVPRSIDGNTMEINGKQYLVYEIRKVALFPTKTGILSVPSLRFEVGLLDQSLSFFSSPRRIFRESPPVHIEVTDLPADAWNLPVGTFSFLVNAEKNEVDVNDILTVKLNIKGKGNVKTLNIPQFKNSEFYEVYPAKISRNYNFNENRLFGVVNSEIPIAFKKAGVISFPALKFKYYDPESAKVVTLTSRPLIISVTGKKESQGSAITMPKTEIVKKGEDIDFIKKGPVFDQHQNFYKSDIFIVLLVVPFLLNLFLILKATVFDKVVMNNKRFTQKKLINNTLNDLKNVKEHGDIHIILENYLKEKTGLGFSEINHTRINDLFKKQNINDYDADAFIRIKSESESSRFSPQKKSPIELKKDISLLLSVLKRIDHRLK
jgi:hypothetical protein